jgi:hypothetical protein
MLLLNIGDNVLLFGTRIIGLFNDLDANGVAELESLLMRHELGIEFVGWWSLWKERRLNEAIGSANFCDISVTWYITIIYREVLLHRPVSRLPTLPKVGEPWKYSVTSLSS